MIVEGKRPVDLADPAANGANGHAANGEPHAAPDPDAQETQEWLDSLEGVVALSGKDRATHLMAELHRRAEATGVDVPFNANTPYVNTVSVEEQPEFPGDRETERRVKSLIRWNAMAMVLRANENTNVGGHIGTFASSANIYEVGFNHFFRGPDHECGGDLIYFQGHASPGMYSRAFLEGRLSEQQLKNFRQELQPGGGLSSYPHPWLMPDFWQFPTVSMGLGPLMAIYQARFNRYLENRGLKKVADQKVWAFLGDGEMDEPESMGALTLASRERLDNLIFVVNCNLQRLDGPVRGNGKIVQELEAAFRGAGWNVIKVLWGSDWDALLEADKSGLLMKRMMEVVDGEYQKYVVSGGAYIREHFFGKYPELLELVKDLSDEQLAKLKRGGHDPVKVYAGYKAAVETKGKPACVLVHTVKGYGLGEAGEGRNNIHNTKKLKDQKKVLAGFRERFEIGLTDADVEAVAFVKPAADTPEMKYLHERRQALGGYLPQRRVKYEPLTPPPASYVDFYKKGSAGGPDPSTTMVFVDQLNRLLRDTKGLGKHLVPIIPDEARTFGMESYFTAYKIYSSQGQKYVPVDDDNELAGYREAKNGQVLEEGINEAGAVSSFIAAGTSYATHGVAMCPFYIYYSMFGFQRIGDLIWAAADLRCRGFLLGATAGRTTLNGEGLQHEDGHSHVLASTVPNVMAYDPAYAFELAVILRDGIRRMYGPEPEDVLYYITLYNDNYAMLPMPEGSEEGILKGMYKLKASPIEAKGPKAHLFGSGPILPYVLRAQGILAEKFGVASDVWSVTSYKQLRADGLAADRWNFLHPDQKPRRCFVEETLAKEGKDDVYVAASDYMRSVQEMIARWVPGGLYALGTDGFGRSETRKALRRHFEVDAECVAVAALYQMSRKGLVPAAKVAEAIKALGIDPEKLDPLTA